VVDNLFFNTDENDEILVFEVIELFTLSLIDAPYRIDTFLFLTTEGTESTEENKRI
jgi:hypothetical protein